MEELEEPSDQIELKIGSEKSDASPILEIKEENVDHASSIASPPENIEETNCLFKENEENNAENSVQKFESKFTDEESGDSYESKNSSDQSEQNGNENESDDYKFSISESEETEATEAVQDDKSVNHVPGLFEDPEDENTDIDQETADSNLDDEKFRSDEPEKVADERVSEHESENENTSSYVPESPCKDVKENLEAPENDELDDSSDFLGFDSVCIDEMIKKKSKLLLILKNEEDEAIKKLNTMDPYPTDYNVQTTEERIGDSAESNFSGGDSVSSNSDKQVTSKRAPTVQVVYGLPVNIFEEQIPSGSKRTVKKRKFFGDFEEQESEKPSKKSSTSRPSQGNAKMNISVENKENYINDDKMRTDELGEGDATSTNQSDSSNQNKARRSHAFDISNPLFREPFKHGWKREICYRNLPENCKTKKTAYVSYFDPNGKKYKTIRQIVEKLPHDSELGPQHFTFSKERIFSEASECELLRHLRNKPDLNESENLNDSGEISRSHPSTPLSLDHSKSSYKKKPATPTGRLVIKKPKYLTQNDGVHDNVETSRTVSSVPSSTTPKIVIKTSTPNSVKSSSSKSKVTNVKKDKKLVSKKLSTNSKKSYEPVENEADSSWDAVDSADDDDSSSSNVRMNGNMPTCSMSCPLALGSIPTLQCSVCLGSYHFECCGIDASLPLHSYVCKNCRIKNEVSSNLLLAVSQKLHSSHEIGSASSRRVCKNTKIVDGVTTWLPSSSNVQLSSGHVAKSSASASATSSPLLQSVLELEGRKYIIVPKESLVSISPNTNTTISYVGQDEQNEPAAASDITSNQAECSASYAANSTDTNSAGVVLVPLAPSRHYSDMCGSSEAADSRNQGSGKRKFSDESDDLYPNCKSAKLDNETMGYHYQSAMTLSNVTLLYDALISCMKYFTVRDLLRISMSCKYLNRLATEPCLWSTVRLKNSRIWDWEGFAKSLRKYGTKKLDMRKMLCPSTPTDIGTMWDNFLKVIPSVPSLEHIEFSRCNSYVVETVVSSCPNLVVVNAVQLRSGFSIEHFAGLKNLRELRLKGLNGLPMEPCDSLEFMSKDIQVLSLTSIKMLNAATVEAIGELRNLRILELGECSNELINANQIADAIGNLHNLERLRLEWLMNMEPDFRLLEAFKNLPSLKYVELVNIEIKTGFEKVMAECQQIEHLLIIPLYRTESSHTNKAIINGLELMPKTLKTFIWGFTNEVMKATAAYASQYFESPSNDDFIPVTKNLSDPPTVELLSMKSLEKTLRSVLPQTDIKLITVAYALTWRQSLFDILKL